MLRFLQQWLAGKQAAGEIEHWSPERLKDGLRQKQKLTILDVRESAEWTTGTIRGARCIPLGNLAARTAELDPNEDIVVVCRSGNRSQVAVRILQQRGFRNVYNLRGGMQAWGGPVQ